jgi:hypothetical protein
MNMSASQMVAGDGIEHAGAQEGGADQDVENVKHVDAPGSDLPVPHAAGMLRCTSYADCHKEAMAAATPRHIDFI